MSDAASWQLERLALERLGLPTQAGPPTCSPLETGELAPHQVQAVRSWLAVHALTCACGARALRDAPCPACGATPGGGPPAAPPVLGPGSRLGPLLLGERLGAGASGAVFRAVNEPLQRPCAVKLLHASRRDPRLLERFRREGKALARLSHPSIVEVYALHELDGLLASEMQLIEGETLEARLARGGPLPWREAAELVARVARGIQHAHEQGVLHRDLKPENVLLRRADGRPFVTDLGLARLSDSTSSLTATGTFLGTPCYMAPEALEGRSEGVGVDVYGLGALLYAALTARPPYVSETIQGLFSAVHAGRCPPSGAPEPLERVRVRAMAREPQDRYPTAGALAEALEEVLAGRGGGRSARPLVAAGLLVLGAAALVAAWAPAPGASPSSPVEVETLAGLGRGTTASYADALCRDLLGRSASPAELTELGALGDRVLLARRLLQGEERLARVVDQEYERLLRRAPDPRERRGWVRRLLAGESQTAIQIELVGSEEYRREFEPARRWVEQLYRDVLGREGEPDAVAEHTADFEQGRDVPNRVRAFVDSLELRERLVREAWRRFLRREPGQAEFERAVGALTAGSALEELWLQLLVSDEYARELRALRRQ